MSTENELFVSEIDAHLRALRCADNQAAAIAWMKTAYQLLERAADDLKRPRVFAVHSCIGTAPTFMLTPPKRLELVQPGWSQPPRGFFDPQVKTVVYSQPKAWTRADTIRLERSNALARSKQACAA